ncbi:MAG: hypothetical protein NTW21_19395 [Verrucomicrobia bacterium]|nr:hypothetical protein [Verrucomicrobiota bacterium]
MNAPIETDRSDPLAHPNVRRLLLSEAASRYLEESGEKAFTIIAKAPWPATPNRWAQYPNSGNTGRGELAGSGLTTIWLGGVIIVAVTFGAAYALYWIIRPRRGAISAGSLGRKWAAWIVAITTISLLPSFFRKLDGDSLALWLLDVFVFGVLAFLIGWIIGLFKFRQQGDEVSTSPPGMGRPVSEGTENIQPSTPRSTTVPPSQTPPLREGIPDNHPKPTMNTNEFEVIIPEGNNLGNGYVEMRHNTQYSLNLKNHRRVPCDAEVAIDGIHVGTWRIRERDEITVDRPVHDTGRFTFFEVGTEAARAAGIAKNTENGLISVTFKPEKECIGLHAAELPDVGHSAGATGLTGESKQRFTIATEIDHDESRFFTIHLRLVARRQDIRPLASRSTPIPPPID